MTQTEKCIEKNIFNLIIIKIPVLATSREELTHWKRLWCWEGLGAGGEGDDRGWDGWMALLTWWTWVWVNSGSWWWTGRPGVLRFMGSQGIAKGRTWLSNWSELKQPIANITLTVKDWIFSSQELEQYKDVYFHHSYSTQGWMFYPCNTYKKGSKK